ncbi:type II toxin-antitoxin system Phd/YefM family antitoxin [Streptomyces specialis]|uniref:type II toxin-antitoxin system Phd/YefM family antitoxin n=1 Tax=Streptomyces specialis TaxID=498367 RepID=UPI00073ED588|nr:type II toxin-antitoxin system Phd/YefM family antitoxin [Streptomyces specialis]
MHWQVQEAKQRFSEVLRQATAGEPQLVTRHGEEVAVILDIREYHRLRGERLDLRDFLLEGHDDELAAELEAAVAARDLPRAVDFGED